MELLLVHRYLYFFCFYVRARMYVYIFLSHVACMPLPNECGATNCFPDSFELAIHLS